MLGNAHIGPVPTDIFIMLLVLVAVHILHAKAAFGRQLVAIGNDIGIARKVGLPVDRTGYFSFVLASALASVGGILTTVQMQDTLLDLIVQHANLGVFRDHRFAPALTSDQGSFDPVSDTELGHCFCHMILDGFFEDPENFSYFPVAQTVRNETQRAFLLGGKQ